MYPLRLKNKNVQYGEASIFCKNQAPKFAQIKIKTSFVTGYVT